MVFVGALDIDRIRKDFPLLSRKINGWPLVYLDNAATTQVPEKVLGAITCHYHQSNANVHRGVHALSSLSTERFEESRDVVADFIGAASRQEVVFTRGTTDSINIVARSWALKGGTSAVVSTMMEHHSNFVPWQQLCRAEKREFLVAPLDSRGDLDIEALETMFRTSDVGLVALAHVSNVLGTVNPIRAVADLAHEHGALVLVDAAQSIRHEPIDVQGLDCDFLCFSGHKMMAPTGIGVLYGKEALLDELPPVAFGGEMVDKVGLVDSTFQKAPLKFESGTPHYVGAIGLAESIRYLDALGLASIRERESDLVEHAEKRLKTMADGVVVLGEPRRRAGCLSFVVDGLSSFDIAALMDSQGFALRSGTLCAQPLLSSLGYEYVVRLSPAFYNTFDEIDMCIDALSDTINVLSSC